MNNEIATTILNQIGGRQFIAMTGSKNFVNTGNGLLMKLSRNASGSQYLRITLNGGDVYDMEFYSVRGIDIKMKNQIGGVYADQLYRIFEQVTGLYTRLY